jgi:hypothetical protein
MKKPASKPKSNIEVKTYTEAQLNELSLPIYEKAINVVTEEIEKLQVDIDTGMNMQATIFITALAKMAVLVGTGPQASSKSAIYSRVHNAVGRLANEIKETALRQLEAAFEAAAERKAAGVSKIQ